MTISRRSVFAPLPFDKLDSVYGTVYQDDFVMAVANADMDGASPFFSDLRWIGDEGGGDGAPSTAIVASVAEHPGIIKLSTGATTPADGDIGTITLPNAILPDVNGVYLSCVARIIDISDTKFQFGLQVTRTEAVNSSAADYIGLVFDPEDAANVGDVMFLAQINLNGTDVESVLNEALITENEWFLLELAADNGGASFRVTTDDGSQTVALNAANDLAMLVGFTVEAVGAAEETVDIDKFTLRYLRRTAADVVGA